MRSLMPRTVIWMLVVGLTAGCNFLTGSEDPSESLPDPPSELGLEFGGYEPTDEEPGFGDASLLAEFSDDCEQPIDDPSRYDPVVVQLEQDAESGLADVYLVRVTWGQLRQEQRHETDWSGSASVSDGALIVRKTILFEPEDALLPREDRLTLGWTSHTYNHIDGLALVILDPQDPAGENQFNFRTGPYSHSFSMEELATLDTLVTVDEMGNAIHFTAFRREHNACQAGFMRGRWIGRGRDWGEFRAGWISMEGDLLGHMEGMWGYDPQGRNVLVGKLIDTEGGFIGLVRGTFGSDISSHQRGGQGWFRGNWYNEQHEVQGVFRGQWREAWERNQGGYMRGLWARDCPGIETNIAVN